LVYTTRLGGSGYDAAISVEVCNDGSVFVSGYTVSSDFHTTDDAIQRTLGGAGDIFLAKLNPDGLIEYSTYFLWGGDYDSFTIALDPSGSRLKFSSYYGGDAMEEIEGVPLAADGSVWTTGLTASHNIRTVNALQKNYNGGQFDALIVKIYPPIK
jgi:hypothetical protein